RVAVADLAGQFDYRRNASQLFDPIPSGDGGVVARAASKEVNARGVFGHLAIETNLIGDHPSRCSVDSSTQRVFDDARLLVNLLEHEVLVAPAFGHDGAPVDP